MVERIIPLKSVVGTKMLTRGKSYCILFCTRYVDDFLSTHTGVLKSPASLSLQTVKIGKLG